MKISSILSNVFSGRLRRSRVGIKLCNTMLLNTQQLYFDAKHLAMLVVSKCKISAEHFDKRKLIISLDLLTTKIYIFRFMKMNVNGCHLLRL